MVGDRDAVPGAGLAVTIVEIAEQRQGAPATVQGEPVVAELTVDPTTSVECPRLPQPVTDGLEQCPRPLAVHQRVGVAALHLHQPTQVVAGAGLAGGGGPPPQPTPRPPPEGTRGGLG